MNVLTNLMALLTPKTAKDGAQTPAAGQGPAGADFAALMAMPVADAAPAGIALPGVPVVSPALGDGAELAAADIVPDTDVAGALPLPQQTTDILAQQIALPIVAAKTVRNAGIPAEAAPGKDKTPVLADDEAPESKEGASAETGLSDGAIALSVPATPVAPIAAEAQMATLVNSAAIQPAPTPAATPAPLPKQNNGPASIETIAATPATGSTTPTAPAASKKISVKQSVEAKSAMPSSVEQTAVDAALPNLVAKPAGEAKALPRAGKSADTAGPAIKASSPLPSPAAAIPVTQSPVAASAAAAPVAAPADVAQAAPVAMPARLAGRASVAAARRATVDASIPVAAPAQSVAPAVAPIPQAIVQAVGGQPATVVAQMATAPAPDARIAVAAVQGADASIEPTTPIIGEATALLRMVAGGGAEPRATTAKTPLFAMPRASAKAVADMSTDAVRPTGDGKVADVKLADVKIADADRPLPTAQPAHVAAASVAAPVVSGASQPVADLSATLGQQVIDMSSGGQWIDGLAKEIATLAAGTGQGSFRLSPEHLGPMRVDIRQGDLGAEISLTVQTAAAESALRQDSDTLKNDAQLSAVRVHEVRVERVHNVAEAARSDSAGNQNNSNNNNGSSWNQGGTQTGFAQSQSQSQAQTQGQGNGQQGSRKVSGGDAVLNHAGPSDQGVEDTQDGLRRARYA